MLVCEYKEKKAANKRVGDSGRMEGIIYGLILDAVIIILWLNR